MGATKYIMICKILPHLRPCLTTGDANRTNLKVHKTQKKRERNNDEQNGEINTH